jgi:RimJ/RimL family protein N-acetyltransferase
VSQQQTLETERLYLRPFTVADADRVQLIVADKRISDMVSNIPYAYPEGGALSWIETSHQKFEQGKSIVFALVSKERDEVIGAMSFQRSSDNEAELGYWLGVDYWGKGYCTESARAVINYGFMELSLKCIKARHLTANPSSGKVIKKLGMRHMESREDNCGDKFESIEFYELLVENYQR